MGKLGIEDRATFVFVGYPVSQAADQRPHIELAQEVASRFNRIYGEVFPVPDGIYGTRLNGTDGQSKMGKSYAMRLIWSMEKK